jgi:hypothetical protein
LPVVIKQTDGVANSCTSACQELYSGYQQSKGIYTGSRTEAGKLGGLILKDVVTIAPIGKDVAHIDPKPSSPVSVEEMNRETGHGLFFYSDGHIPG